MPLSVTEQLALLDRIQQGVVTLEQAIQRSETQNIELRAMVDSCYSYFITHPRTPETDALLDMLAPYTTSTLRRNTDAPSGTDCIDIRSMTLREVRLARNLTPRMVLTRMWAYNPRRLELAIYNEWEDGVREPPQYTASQMATVLDLSQDELAFIISNTMYEGRNGRTANQ